MEKPTFFGSNYNEVCLVAGWAYMFWHQSTAAFMLIIINDACLCRLQAKLKPFRCIFILISLRWAGLFSVLY